MQDTDLQVLPGPPHAFLKRRVLEELLRNPFLDEDALALSLRLGVPESEVAQALNGLLQSRFLRAARGRGFMLDMELAADPAAPPPIDLVVGHGPIAPPTWELTPEEQALAVEIGAELDVGCAEHSEPASESPGVEPPLAAQPIDLHQSLSEIFPSGRVELTELVEALPFGVIALNAQGALEVGNQKAADWLGIPIDNLDAATFELVTGVNPMPIALGGEPGVTFSVTRPHAVEIGIHPGTMVAGAAALIVIRDVALQEEISRLQSDVQEELFAVLQADMVHPLRMIEQFLRHPDDNGLAEARAAMGIINSFLRMFFLQPKNDAASY